MSKNNHMHSTTSLRVGPDIATEGAVGLAQGAYGARGNLELVACDVADGLWVFWFNTDLEADPLETPAVPPGSWSAGLRFAVGCRYRDAQIVQSTLGPNHLEVLALDDSGDLQSWYWSPGPGFQRRVTDAASDVTRFAVAHERGSLFVTIADAEDAVRHVTSPPRGYPSRAWVPSATGPLLADDGIARAALIAAGIADSDIAAGTARCAPSTRAGGTTELTWRSASGSIHHLGIPSR